ncbi:class II glutamine amidotransferase [Haliangium sp.]|uniref:class II glutamine amidotransferase n=1 Tax=Haliangium sp. TaxID=2663208 RepID=UPI003D0F7BA9
MSQLLAMSFDSASSPAITLTAWDDRHIDDAPGGWGFGWYPSDDYAAAVIKDPAPSGDASVSHVLRDWERFRASAFLCHIRGAAKRVTQQDTQPFARPYARRHWLFAHSGDLAPGYRDALPIADAVAFEPVGRTDSEHAFCWLLNRFHRMSARRLSEVGWPELHAMFRELDALGTANILLSDGQDVVAYRDLDGDRPLGVTRRVPPHARTRFANEIMELSVDDPLDSNRTMVLIATTPLSEEGWLELEPGHMLVTRRGAITWCSQAAPETLRFDIAPAPVSATAAPARAVAPAPAAPAADADEGPHRQAPAPASMPAPTAAQAAAGRQHAPTSEAVERAQPPRRMNPPAHPEARPRPDHSRVLRVRHETIYRYQSPVEHSVHLFRLQPVHDHGQELLDYEFEMSPRRVVRSFEDVFGNRAKRIKVDQPYTELRLRVDSLVRVYAPTPLSSPVRRSTIPLVWMPWQRQMVMPYLLPAELPETQLEELSEFAMSFAERQDYNLVDTLNDLNLTLYRDFSYMSGSTSLETTPFEVYTHRRGVCQDFANLFICLARLLGVPARYRVGYIYTGSDYENKIQSEASHAWVELYLPWVGWRGFDPTNGCQAGLDHVRVAVGRNYRDATPTSGTIYKGGGGESLHVEVKVETLDHDGDDDGGDA